jgi:hypothetical protein
MKSAGEAQPPSRHLTGPASPRRSVCAPAALAFHGTADQLERETLNMALLRWLRGWQPWPFGAAAARRRATRHGPVPRFRPRLEVIEGRYLPSTLTVLNTNDSGPGSLRAEIAAAQSGDTILVDPSLNGQQIALTSGQLVIDRSLDIEGPGPGATFTRAPFTVFGTGTDRVFDILSGATVTFSGLAIGPGVATQGGDIYNAGSLKLTGCVVGSGFATGSAASPGMGGGIDNAAGATLTVSQSFIGENAAVFAEVINPDGTESFQGANELGGGIYEAGGLVRIDNSTLQENDAEGIIGPDGPGSSFGGAIYVAGGTLQVVHCTVWGNEAGGGSVLPSGFAPSAGSAIYQAAGIVSITNSLFLNNGAGDPDGPPYPAQGGAIYLRAGSLALTNDHFFQNGVAATDAQGAGGAIYQAGGSLSMTNCIFSGNIALADNSGLPGGGGNISQGGAIYIGGGTLTIQSCAFDGNAADAPLNPPGSPDQSFGGAIYIAGGSVCISKNTTFTNNFASSSPDVFGPFTLC